MTEAQMVMISKLMEKYEISKDEMRGIARAIAPGVPVQDLNNKQIDAIVKCVAEGKSLMDDKFRLPAEMRVELAGTLAQKAVTEEVQWREDKSFDFPRWESLFRKMFTVMDRQVFVMLDTEDSE